MAAEDNLNGKNIPLIILFVVWCVTIYVAFISSPLDFWNKSESIFKELNTKDGVFLLLSPIIALILNGIVSSANKARLVFLRWKYALPGHRAFSDLIKRDSRIDINKLTAKMGKLPRKPTEQNSKWYSIYKRYSNSVTVKQAHKAFLLSRDLCTISFLFTVIGSLGIYFDGQNLKWTALFFIIMAGHYITLAIVAQNYGKRFVCNVIAEFSTDEK